MTWSRASRGSPGIVLAWAIAACAARGPRDAGGAGRDTLHLRHSSGAVESLSGETLANARVARIEELLPGRIAGIQVLRMPDGEYSIRVRNATSFQGNSEPLLVVDGMPVRGRSLHSALESLMAADIARIDVLKDASAAGAYGSEGANGVIVITTKRRR